METEDAWRSEPLVVLVSGGMDSLILTAELAETSPLIVPIYVRSGLFWEDTEEEHLHRFLREVDLPNVKRLQILDAPLTGIYGEHWSTLGQDVPGADTPDEAVYLPGRNLTLLLQASLWCQRKDIDVVAMGVLKNNPFPDSTDVFFRTFESALAQGLNHRIRVVRPYSHLSKQEVLQRGRFLPLEHTWSCIQPIQQVHCGKCNKCAERQRAFLELGIPDCTQYVREAHVSGTSQQR